MSKRRSRREVQQAVNDLDATLVDAAAAVDAFQRACQRQSEASERFALYGDASQAVQECARAIMAFGDGAKSTWGAQVGQEAGRIASLLSAAMISLRCQLQCCLALVGNPDDETTQELVELHNASIDGYLSNRKVVTEYARRGESGAFDAFMGGISSAGSRLDPTDVLRRVESILARLDSSH